MMKSTALILWNICKAILVFSFTMIVTMILHNMFLPNDIFYIFNFVTSIVVTGIFVIYPKFKRKRSS